MSNPQVARKGIVTPEGRVIEVGRDSGSDVVFFYVGGKETIGRAVNEIAGRMKFDLGSSPNRVSGVESLVS